MSGICGSRALRIVTCLLIVVSAIAFLGNTMIGRVAASYSGGISANPNPMSSWTGTTITCSWNAYKYSLWPNAITVYCYLDGKTFFYSTAASGSKTYVVQGGTLGGGSHTMTVKYSIGITTVNHLPQYIWQSVSSTLVVNEPSYFQAKVVDKNLNGIPNAVVTLDYSTTACGGQNYVQGAYTDSTGLAVITIACFVPSNTYTMNIQKQGYWTDLQSFLGTQNFYVGLPQDKIAYVYGIVAFTNSKYSQVTWTKGVSINVQVGAYLAGSGFDFSYTASSTTTLSGSPPPNGAPLEERDGYMSTGQFHYNQNTKTYTIDNAWLYGSRVTLNFGYFVPDYFTPSTATGGTCFFSPCQFGLGPGVGLSNTLTVSGSLTVQLGLDVTVGVDVNVIVGVSVSVELKVYMAVTVGVSYSLTWLIQNTDTVSHTFEVFDETASNAAIIPHVWMIS